MTVENFNFSFLPFEPGQPVTEPIWKDKMDRWYQLDEISRALCEAVYAWTSVKKLIFDQIIFVGEQGSNLADADFVSGVAFSPSKFVYTLPSIGPSLISQILNWHGPVYCLGVGDTLSQTLRLARQMASNKALNFKQKTLVLYSAPGLDSDGKRRVGGELYSLDS